MKQRPPLKTSDIRRALAGEPGFVGVYAINRVKDINAPKHRSISFVANLQADNLPGNHWVAVRRMADGNANYFDSFGRVPPLEIQHWLMKNSSIWTHNNLIVQKPNDKSACGYLCIKYVKNKL